MPSKTFKKDGMSVIVESDPHEMDEHHNVRGWFICWYKKTYDDTDSAITLSRAYLSYKMHDCTYSDEMMKLFTEYERSE